MSGLGRAATDYLALRRSLGYKLEAHHRLLPQFVEFLERRHAMVITNELALEWATQPAGSVVWWHQRLAIVAGFARYMQASDPRHQVPPTDLLPAKFRRAIPYLYSEADVAALMQAARRIASTLKAATYETLIGLLSVTGMRIGEVIGLDRSDVVLPERSVTVRHGKNGRSREVALHPTTVAALDVYARVRDELCPHPEGPASWSPTAAGGCTRGRSGTSSTSCVAPAAWTGRRSGAKPASTTYATRSCCARCSAGIAKTSTSKRDCRCCPRSSGTSIHPTPTGTSRRPRSCWRSPRSGSRRPGSSAHDCAVAPAAGVLHRAPRRSTRRQPAHGRRLPRRVPAAPGVRARASWDGAVEAPARGSRRRHDHRVLGPPRADAPQQRADPQRAADRDPLVSSTTRR